MLLSTVERWPGSPKAETALSLVGSWRATRSWRTAGSGRSSRLAWKALSARAAARCSGPCGRATGTKNPKYSDVKYVEELIAPTR